jgi:hypothetical protein
MELSDSTRKLIIKLSKSYYNFQRVPTNINVGLIDILSYNLPCSIHASKITNNRIPHDGDVLIGFYALEPVQFTMKLQMLLPSYIHKLYNSTEPEPFAPITHNIAKNTFVYAYAEKQNDYVINMQGMQYNHIELINMHCSTTMKLLAIYGCLSTEERMSLLSSKQSLIYICPSLENRMASKIQRQWRESISNPIYTLCRTRLISEFLTSKHI